MEWWQFMIGSLTVTFCTLIIGSMINALTEKRRSLPVHHCETMPDNISEIIPVGGWDKVSFGQLTALWHTNAVNKGFWDSVKDQRLGDPVYKLTLMIEEIIEAFGDIRSGHSPETMWITDEGKPDGPAVEIADLLIRLGDYCAHWDIPVIEIAEMKHRYNTGRPAMHGRSF